MIYVLIMKILSLITGFTFFIIYGAFLSFMALPLPLIIIIIITWGG
jgi:hypothetical protein